MLRKNFQAEYLDAIERRDPLCMMKPQEDLPASPVRMWPGDPGVWQSRQESWDRQAVVPHSMLPSCSLPLWVTQVGGQMKTCYLHLTGDAQQRGWHGWVPIVHALDPRANISRKRELLRD